MSQVTDNAVDQKPLQCDKLVSSEDGVGSWMIWDFGFYDSYFTQFIYAL